MLERGGPAAQGNFLYQNTITALRLGRLCDGTFRPPSTRIIAVQSEAIADVDDIVVTYQDDHRDWIQAKGNLERGSDAWMELWPKFVSQMEAKEFQSHRDNIVLCVDGLQGGNDLKAMVLRARDNADAAQWQSRLTKQQMVLLNSISGLLPNTWQSHEQLLLLFQRLRVEVETLEALEDDAERWMPQSNKRPRTLFRLLRDLVAERTRWRGTFRPDELRQTLSELGVHFEAPLPLEELRNLLATCNASLRAHRDGIGAAGITIPRPVVNDIVRWIDKDEIDESDSQRDKNIALLLDRAGMGKTVVMRRVLEILEERGTPVLAIKADLQLSGMTDWSDLDARLNKLGPIEKLVERFDGQRFVLIIDQVDALSLSLARDSQALTLMTQLVERAQRLPGVRILLSCRTFDLHSDPRLSRFESAKRFGLPLLSEVDVEKALTSLNPAWHWETLASATRHLLRTPLHLALWVRSLEVEPESQPLPQGLSSLQDLYARLWDTVVLRSRAADGSGLPSQVRREAAIRLIVETMYREQVVTAPASLFTSEASEGLCDAVNYLASEGILLRSRDGWAFLHQTFFDYAFARFFVEERITQGQSISGTILSAPQDLRARPKTLQVLGYIRGRNHALYVYELELLLSAPELQPHLRDLIVRWFGSLPEPTDLEWALARRVLFAPLENTTLRRWLLGAMSGNLDWFARLKGDVLRALMTDDETFLQSAVLPYLQSISYRQPALLLPELETWLSQGRAGLRRVHRILSNIEDWSDPKLAAFCERLFEVSTDPEADFGTQERTLKSMNEWDSLRPIEKLSKYHPETYCRIISKLAQQALRQFVALLSRPEVVQDEDENFYDYYRRRCKHHDEEDVPFKALSGHSVRDTLGTVAKEHPAIFLEQMLPHFLAVVALRDPLYIAAEASPRERELFSYLSDELTPSYTVRDFWREFLKAFTTALRGIAQTNPQAFLLLVERLSAIATTTPQLVVSQALRAAPELYASDALRFLLEDRRRLMLESKQYETRMLLRAITPHLSADEFSCLERYILDFAPLRFYWSNKLAMLQKRGEEQLNLLLVLPFERLSSIARSRLREWQRKFPKHKLKEAPPFYGTLMAEFVPSPISPDATDKMSDDQWLRAIGRYPNENEHTVSEGGARELSYQLQRVASTHPQRFAEFAIKHLPKDIDKCYIEALLRGLTKSSLPKERLFDVVRHFTTVYLHDVKQDIRHEIAEALEHAQELNAEPLPEDMLALLETIVRGKPCQSENWWREEERKYPEQVRYDGLNGGPYQSFRNSARGSAFRALGRALGMPHVTPEERELRLWSLFEFAAQDRSSALRAGAIEYLLYEYHDNRERAVELFGRLMHGHPALLRSYYTHEFILYASFRFLPDVQRYVLRLLRDTHPKLAEQGGLLAARIALSLHSSESPYTKKGCDLGNRALHASPGARCGAATVYTHNVAMPEASTLCIESVLTLLDDQDESVQKAIAGMFSKMSVRHFWSARSFIDTFAKSRSLTQGLSEFTEYLNKHGSLDPQWALNTVEAILNNPQLGEEEDIWSPSGDALIRLVLRLYADAADDVFCTQAMCLFGRLMERYTHRARIALNEWDDQ
jgi:hypothetical protein